MDRRQFITHCSLIAAGTALPFSKIMAQPKGNFKLLRRNVGYFTERGGTIGWLTSENAMAVVDSQYPESARHCLNGLRDRTDHPLDLLVNTHHHADHTSGNPVFNKAQNRIVAHENVPGLMKQASEEGDDNDVYPNETFSKSWKADLGDETIHAKYYGPAHTGGDSVVYFEKANVVHVGDLVFNRMNPFTDRPGGASMQNWVTVLETVADEYPADALYIFGHGKPEAGVTGKKQDLFVMRDYFSAILDYVEKAIEEGKSKEEITDKKVMDGFENFLYADFWTLPDNLGVAYEELTQS